MAFLQVLDKVSQEMVNVKIDSDALKKVNHFNYMLDKYSRKPFREVKDNKKVIRYFLDRDILDLKLNDGIVVYHRNTDPLDCRRENLVEKERAIASVSRSGHYWPKNSESLIHFLSKREGEDHDVAIASEFLAKVDVQKYNKKRVDIMADADDYDSFKKKNIEIVIKRVLHKYFDWNGVLNITKNLKPLLDENKEPSVVEQTPMPPPPPSHANVKSDIPEIEYEFEEAFKPASKLTFKQLKTELYHYAFSTPDLLMDCLRDNKLFPTEAIIRVLQERGANMVQFTSFRN